MNAGGLAQSGLKNTEWLCKKKAIWSCYQRATAVLPKFEIQ